MAYANACRGAALSGLEEVAEDSDYLVVFVSYLQRIVAVECDEIKMNLESLGAVFLKFLSRCH